MRPSEILERAHDAAVRMAVIEDEIAELRERIGVQGHSYERHGKNGVLDPMRKVDDALDGTTELERERVECLTEVTAAWPIVSGMEARASYLRQRSEDLRMAGDAESSEALWMEADVADAEASVMAAWAVYGRDASAMGAEMGVSESSCRHLLEAGLLWCDNVGVARLKSCATYE